MKRKKRLIITLAIVVSFGLFLRFGLPLMLHAAGLHPEYRGPKYSLPEGRALIITTSHDRLGEDGDKTGVAASEMTEPYYVFKDSGMKVDLASIKGGEIPVDPMTLFWFIRSYYDNRYLSDEVFQQQVKNSYRIDDIDFKKYDIIYLAGGWGAAYDLGYSTVLGKKISEAYAAGKVVGGVCHGPLCLLLATDQKGNSLVSGRRLTAVTDKQVKELGITMTPQHPERELRAAGALFESQTAFRDMLASHTVVDGTIVTGQNQNDGVSVAYKMIEAAGGEKNND